MPWNGWPEWMSICYLPISKAFPSPCSRLWRPACRASPRPAMACTQDAIEDGQTGYLCPARHIEPWLARLQLLIHDPDLRRQMGRNSLRRWKECFSLEAMARGTAAVYEKVLAAADRRS